MIPVWLGLAARICPAAAAPPRLPRCVPFAPVRPVVLLPPVCPAASRLPRCVPFFHHFELWKKSRFFTILSSGLLQIIKNPSVFHHSELWALLVSPPSLPPIKNTSFFNSFEHQLTNLQNASVFHHFELWTPLNHQKPISF